MRNKSQPWLPQRRSSDAQRPSCLQSRNVTEGRACVDSNRGRHERAFLPRLVMSAPSPGSLQIVGRKQMLGARCVLLSLLLLLSLRVPDCHPSPRGLSACRHDVTLKESAGKAARETSKMSNRGLAGPRVSKRNQSRRDDTRSGFQLA